MPRPDLRSDFLIAALAGAVLMILVGVSGALMLRAAEQKALPELAETIRAGGDAVGTAVAGQIGKALDYGIPLEGLVGVENYFADVVAGVPTVEALALADPDGKVLFSTRADVTGPAFLVVSGEKDPASVILSPAPPYFGRALERLRAALAVTALLTGLISAAIVFLVLRRQVSAGRNRLRALMQRVAAGELPALEPVGGRGITVDAMNAFERCTSPLKASLSRLEDEVAVVRAIDFDGSLAAGLGPVLKPVDALRSSVGSAAESRAAAPSHAQHRQFALWLLALAAGFYGMTLPFAANFAIDRQWAYATPEWWPVLPWVGQGLAMLAAYALARSLPARFRSAAALTGLLGAGIALSGIYWTRDYGLFLGLFSASGAGLGIAITALTDGRGSLRRDTTFALIVILAVLFAGPLLGGLLGEAIGRRTTFLTAGMLLAATGFLSLTVRWAVGQHDTDHSDRVGVSTTAFFLDPGVAAGAAIGALALVWAPMSIGFDDYFSGGLLIAVTGAGLAFGRFIPWPSAATLAPFGLAAISLVPSALSASPSALLAFAAALLTGIGAGALLRLSRDRGHHALPPLAVGGCLGAVSVGAALSLTIPPVSLAALIVALLTVAAWMTGRKPATVQARG
jgi:hypothetical protein